MDPPGRCEGAAHIMRAFPVSFDPFVDGAICRAGIKREQCAIRHARRNVRHTTQIQHRARAITRPLQQRAMIDRRQRGALPTRCHVCRPEIISERHPERSLQAKGIDQLKRRARMSRFGSAMKDSLAMHACQRRDHTLTPTCLQHLPRLCVRMSHHPARRLKHIIRRRSGPVPGTRRIRRIL